MRTTFDTLQSQAQAKRSWPCNSSLTRARLSRFTSPDDKDAERPNTTIVKPDGSGARIPSLDERKCLSSSASPWLEDKGILSTPTTASSSYIILDQPVGCCSGLLAILLDWVKLAGLEAAQGRSPLRFSGA